MLQSGLLQTLAVFWLGKTTVIYDILFTSISDHYSVVKVVNEHSQTEWTEIDLIQHCLCAVKMIEPKVDLIKIK